MSDIVFYFIDLFAKLPPELATMFLSMIPIVELRLSIPIGITIYHLPVWTVYFWSIVGDMLPTFFIYYALRGVSQWLMANSKFFNKILNKIFANTHKKFVGKYEKYGALALIIFVAIPLPGTGSWTGTVAAWLFDIPWRKAFWLLLMGVLMAGLLVTGLTLGFTNLF